MDSTFWGASRRQRLAWVSVLPAPDGTSMHRQPPRTDSFLRRTLFRPQVRQFRPRESPRVSRRLHILGGWSPWEDRGSTHQKYGTAPCGSCLSTKTSTTRSGPRSDPWPRRSAARRRRCGHWVRQAERDQGRRPGLTTDERAVLKEQAREIRELRRANEILRKASAYFAQAELDRRPR